MRSASILMVAAVLAACSPAKESTPAAGPTLASFAGGWTVSSTLTGVENPVPSTMTGTAESSAWSMSLEGRPNIALTVSVVGDSLIGQSAEYESVLRAGVMVSVRTASVLSGDMLMGNVVATYKSAGGVEIVNGTMHGTRAMK